MCMYIYGIHGGERVPEGSFSNQLLQTVTNQLESTGRNAGFSVYMCGRTHPLQLYSYRREKGLCCMSHEYKNTYVKSKATQ